MEEILNKGREIDMQPYMDMATSMAVQAVAALVIILFGFWIAKRVKRWLEKAMLRSKVDATLTNFLGNIAHGGVVAFVIIAALAQIGIQTASLAAVIAAAGLAIGLALQGSLSNFAAGVMLILFRPFKAGDYIDAGGTAGTVQEVSILTTIMKTPDNVQVIVPNSTVFSGVITNYSTNDTRRMNMTIGVGYADDLAKVKQVLYKIIEDEPRILKDPAPVVAVNEMGASSMNLVFRPWVKTSDFWDVHFELTEKIKNTFDKEGISIPFPQREIRIVSEDSSDIEKAA